MPTLNAIHVAGGANIPAVNDLLEPFGAAFGDAVLEGDLTLADDSFGFMSGANLARLPAGAWLHTAGVHDKATVGALHPRPCSVRRTQCIWQGPWKGDRWCAAH